MKTPQVTPDWKRIYIGNGQLYQIQQLKIQ